MKCLGFILLLMLFCIETGYAQVTLPRIFSDNMVLQRNQPIAVWGNAGKGETVIVTLGDRSVSVIAGKKGEWRVQLPQMEAGGPYKMIVGGTVNRVVFDDVLIGDVWLCSGQSNMEFKMRDLGNVPGKSGEPVLPQVRLLTVPRVIDVVAQKDMPETAWTRCDSATIPDFSAVAYYFGKDIQAEIGVPVGLINASWGGSKVNPWTSWEWVTEEDTAFREFKGKSLKKILGDGDKEVFMKALESDRGLKNKWYLPRVKLGGWKQVDVPGKWTGELSTVDGVVWFATDIELPLECEGLEAILHLGNVDDEDITWVNGRQVGTSGIWFALRHYNIEKGILRPGKNRITVRIKDIGGEGGIMGQPREIFLEVGDKRYELAGKWRYKTSVLASAYKVVQDQNTLASLLFNGMINPLVGYGIKGVIWYQGEADDMEAYLYRSRFPRLIRNWRSLWGYDFPFLWVQLANFKAVKEYPAESEWAELREAQNMALSLPYTGQAVITDIGEAFDIHPKNKWDVGFRLCQNALKVAYGKNVLGSGPEYESMEIEGNKIVIHFSNVGKGLSAKDKNRYGYLRGFSIAGKDRKFVWAKAWVEDGRVIVFSEKVTDPVAVRYGWADNPYDADLVNSDGLLASPFRTDSWKGITEK